MDGPLVCIYFTCFNGYQVNIKEIQFFSPLHLLQIYFLTDSQRQVFALYSVHEIYSQKKLYHNAKFSAMFFFKIL